VLAQSGQSLLFIQQLPCRRRRLILHFLNLRGQVLLLSGQALPQLLAFALPLNLAVGRVFGFCIGQLLGRLVCALEGLGTGDCLGPAVDYQQQQN
jgi:hypothetical protein